MKFNGKLVLLFKYKISRKPCQICQNFIPFGKAPEPLSDSKRSSMYQNFWNQNSTKNTLIMLEDKWSASKRRAQSEDCSLNVKQAGYLLENFIMPGKKWWLPQIFIVVSSQQRKAQFQNLSVIMKLPTYHRLIQCLSVIGIIVLDWSVTPSCSSVIGGKFYRYRRGLCSNLLECAAMGMTIINPRYGFKIQGVPTSFKMIINVSLGTSQIYKAWTIVRYDLKMNFIWMQNS